MVHRNRGANLGDGGDIRFRECRTCGGSFTTREKVVVSIGYGKGYVDIDKMNVELPPVPKPKAPRAVPRYRDVPAKEIAAVVHGRLPEPMVQKLAEWWNESRWSKHRAKAVWTERAFRLSVERLAHVFSMYPERAESLLDKALEAGWMQLSPTYLDSTPTGAPALPPASTGLAPASADMQLAVSQWNAATS